MQCVILFIVMETVALFPGVNERDGASKWARPQENITKVSVNAAIFTGNAAYGIGLVARNSDAEVIHA